MRIMLRYWKGIYINAEEMDEKFEGALLDKLLELRQQFPTLDWDRTWETEE